MVGFGPEFVGLCFWRVLAYGFLGVLVLGICC